MARKTNCFFVSYKYMFYMVAVASLCAGLVVLQHFCMNHKDGDFVTNYCLADSHMRAVLAAILTIIGLVLTSSVASAVESYRSAKLASGINEGVYIAMASQSVKYHLQALLTSWGPVMMLVILCTNAPNAIQTLANLGIKTAGVYVRNNSTATVYDHYSYYNASVAPESPNLDFAIRMLAKMTAFRTSATSRIVDSTTGAVATSVLRDGYLGQIDIVRTDVTNAFEHLETVVTITSNCSTALISGPLKEAVPPSPNAVNVTILLPDDGFAAALVYEVDYNVSSNNSVLFYSSLSEPVCQGSDCTALNPNTFVTGSINYCTSSLIVQDQDIVYTVSTDAVTPVRVISNTTTVNAIDLASLIVSFAKSIEATPEALSNSDYVNGVIDQFSNFPSGSFDMSESNLLHTKLCAASALALNFLWTNYGLNSSNIDLDGMVGNAFEIYDAFLPLYNNVQLTYISTANIAVIAGVITASACIVALVGMFFAVTSRINVKPATDSSLLYNADPALVARKQALMAELSNDPRGQLDLEFKADSVLFCREVAVKYPNPADPMKQDTYCRVNICYNDAGEKPNKSNQYW